MGMSEVVGYTRKGRPVYAIRGGSTDADINPTGVPVSTPPPPAVPPTALSADDLARARQEWEAQQEAEWQRRQQALEAGFNERLRPFEEQRAEQERLAAEARQAQEDAERRAREAEETAAQRAERIAQEAAERTRELEARLAERDAMLAREQARQELIAYRASAIEAARDNIYPALLPGIQGFTREEIDASIQHAVAASQQIISDFAGRQEQQQQAALEFQRQQPGVSPTAPVTGPPDMQEGIQTLSAEQIAALDDRTYEQLRPQLMAAAKKFAGYGGR